MSRPPIPRPNSSPISVPRPVVKAAPPAVYPAPMMREKLETLELIDDDIVDSQVVRKSAPPPLRKTSVPPPPRSEIRSLQPVVPVAAPVIPPAAKLPTRISVIDPIDIIFGDLSDLGACETMREAAALCARALAKALCAKAVLVHAHDLLWQRHRVEPFVVCRRRN